MFDSEWPNDQSCKLIDTGVADPSEFFQVKIHQETNSIEMFCWEDSINLIEIGNTKITQTKHQHLKHIEAK